jgi:hypothetical protein
MTGSTEGGETVLERGNPLNEPGSVPRLEQPSGPRLLSLLHSLESMVQQAHLYVDHEAWDAAMDAVQRMHEQRTCLPLLPHGAAQADSDALRIALVETAERLEREHVRLVARLTSRRAELAQEIERIRHSEQAAAAYQDTAPSHSVDIHR